MTRPLALAAGCAAVLLLACPAAADPRVHDILYLPVGANLGAAIHPGLRSGFLFGAEASLVYPVSSGLWYGGYVDALGDTGARAFRWSTGPELGFGFVGLDGGYLGQAGKAGYSHGVTARGLLTLGLVAVYGRWGHLFGDTGAENFAEVGALLKFPIELWRNPKS